CSPRPVPPGESAPTRREAVLGNCGGQEHRLPALPVVPREIIGDAADDICGARPEIDPAVAVEVHGELAIAAWHELRNAERSGERSLQRDRIDVLLAREQQEFPELAAKENRPPPIVERPRLK